MGRLERIELSLQITQICVLSHWTINAIKNWYSRPGMIRHFQCEGLASKNR